MFRVKRGIIFLLILLLAVSLRLYGLEKYNLSYDEAVTALEKGGIDKLPSFEKLLDAKFLTKNHDYLAFYSHGFVYYWQRLVGKSEFPLRLSSVIFSILSIVLLYLLIKSTLGAKLAYLSIFLLTISPFSIYHSQELRPYAIISFLTLLITYSFIRILNNDRKYFYIYIIGTVLNAYFHYMTIFIFLTFCIFSVFIVKKRKHLLRAFFTANAVIVFFLIPIFLSLLPNFKFVIQNSIDPVLSEFPTWGEKVNFTRLLYTLKNFSIGYNTDFFTPLSILIFASYFLFFLYGILSLHKKIEAKLFLSVLLMPTIFLFITSQIRTCYVDRYLFAALPFYLIFVATGLSRLNNRLIFSLAVLLIAMFNFFGLRNYYLGILPRNHLQHVAVTDRVDIKTVAKILSGEYQKGDKILQTCRNTIFPLKFYIIDFTNNPDLISEINSGTLIFTPDYFKEPYLFTYDYDVMHPNSVLLSEYKVPQYLEDTNRFWLIFSSWYFNDLNVKEHDIVEIMKNRFREIKCEKFKGGYIFLFAKNLKYNTRNKR